MIRIKKANQLPCFLEPVSFRQAGMGHQSLFAARSFPKSLQLFAADPRFWTMRWFAA
jgi:hypothetical protein